MDLEEIAEFFATQLECRGMMFNFIRGLSRDNTIEVPQDTLTDQLIKAYRIFRRCGVYEDRMMRKIKAFVYEKPLFYDCGACGGQIALCADGMVGPCHIAADDHRFCWGPISRKGLEHDILTGALTQEWCRRSPRVMNDCSRCIGLSLCGGGCAEEAYMKSGDPFAIDSQRCAHTRRLLDWMLDDLASKLIKSGEMFF
jgi:uncharacterized protein